MITLNDIITRHPTIVDLIEYIKTFPVGEYLPGEREVAEAVGWNRATIREHAIYRVLWPCSNKARETDKVR